MSPHQSNPDLGWDGAIFTFRNRVTWATKSGAVPKDLSRVETRLVKCSRELLWATGVFASAAAVVTLGLTVQNFLAINLLPNTAKFYFDAFKKVVVILSCLLLDLSSVFKIFGAYYFPVEECKFRPLLSVIALSIFNGILVALLAAYASLMQFTPKDRGIKRSKTLPSKSRASRQPSGPHVPQKSVGSRSQVSNEANTGIPAVEYSTVIDRKLIAAAAAIATLGIVTVLTWVIGFPASSGLSLSEAMFDEVADGYYKKVTPSCSSDMDVVFLSALLAYGALLLLTAVFYAYRTTRLAIPDDHKRDSSRLKIAAINSLFIYATVILAGFVVSGSDIPCMGLAVISFGEVAFSLANVGILLI